jgi:hypothetical protein
MPRCFVSSSFFASLEQQNLISLGSMSPERDAEYALALIKEYIANEGKAFRYVRVKIASYETENDFRAFKPDQQWDVYNKASELLGKLCKERGWDFDDSNVVRADVFDKMAKQNGQLGDISQRIDFVLTLLGHEVQDGGHRVAYGVSPLVVLLSPEPNFLPQSTMHSGYVIPK